MDSLIYYTTPDLARALSALAERTTARIVFTVAPRTPLLMAMWRMGKLFPQSDRSPVMVPQSARALARALEAVQSPARLARSGGSRAASTSARRWSCGDDRRGQQTHQFEADGLHDALSALCRCREREPAALAAPAAVALSGLRGHGDGDAAGHAQPGDDRRAFGARGDRRGDDRAAGADRAVPRAARLSLRHLSQRAGLETHPLSLVRVAVADGRARGHALCPSGAVGPATGRPRMGGRGARGAGLHHDGARAAHDADRRAGAGLGPGDRRDAPARRRPALRDVPRGHGGLGDRDRPAAARFLAAASGARGAGRGLGRDHPQPHRPVEAGKGRAHDPRRAQRAPAAIPRGLARPDGRRHRRAAAGGGVSRHAGLQHAGRAAGALWRRGPRAVGRGDHAADRDLGGGGAGAGSRSPGARCCAAPTPTAWPATGC